MSIQTDSRIRAVVPASQGQPRVTAAPDQAVPDTAAHLSRDQLKRAATVGLVGGATSSVAFVGVNALSSYVSGAITAYTLPFHDGPLLKGMAEVKRVHQAGVAYMGETFRPSLSKIAILSSATAAGAAVTYKTGSLGYGMAVGSVISGGATLLLTRNLKTSLAMAGGGAFVAGFAGYVTKSSKELGTLK